MTSAMTRSIRRNAIGLGLFAVITGGTIALTQVLTAERIQQQVARAEASALFEIIPRTMHNNDILSDPLPLPPARRDTWQAPDKAWVARQGGELVGLIMPVVAPDGYSGAIHLLVGIRPDGEVLGVRVTSHRETPGLGDRIEHRKSDWIESFRGRSLADTPRERWAVKKDGGIFDQFTGATITPRAVVSAVRDTLIYYDNQRQSILTALSNREASANGQQE